MLENQLTEYDIAAYNFNEDVFNELMKLNRLDILVSDKALDVAGDNNLYETYGYMSALECASLLIELYG